MEKYSNGQKRINKDLIIYTTKTKLPYKGLLAALLLGAMPAVGADLDTPTLGEDSGYTLTKVDTKGENTITKFEYDSTTGVLTPVYFRVDLVKTEYGDKTADSAKPMYFKWVEDAEGNRIFTQEGATAENHDIVYYAKTEYGDKTVASAKPIYFKWVEDAKGNKTFTQEGATAENHDIVYYAKTEYGNPNGELSKQYGWEKNADNGKLEFKENPTVPIGETIVYKYTEQGYTETKTNTLDKGTITDPAGTEDNPTIIEGGASLNNPAGTTITIDNILYKDNIVRAEVQTTTSGNKYADVLGGAVYNAGTITEITGAFVNNGLEVTASNLVGNYTSYLYSYAYGGAIANTGNIGDITGNFIDNSVIGSSGAYGGAIANYAKNNDIKVKIGNITGNFIGNSTIPSSTYAYTYGGAISNYANSANATAEIGNITGNFIDNYASFGGAIYNYVNGTNATAEIGNITGDFIGNSAMDGGAIYNYANGTNATAKIGNITGDFIGNYNSSPNYPKGGAIYNCAGTNATAEIGDITGRFVGNYASSGGAIYNYTSTANYITKIGNITGDFIGNYGTNDGGAILNEAYYKGSVTIGNITGDFIGNYISGFGDIYGGAIYNHAYSASTSSNANATIDSITGNFIGNYVFSGNNYAYGGAISNKLSKSNSLAKIGDITGDFIGNYVNGDSAGYGGAIYNEGIIGNITGDFVGNYTDDSRTDFGSGGAIWNDGFYSKAGIIGNITGDFIGNFASYSGGAISVDNGTIGNIFGNFIGNYAKNGVAGAIENDRSIIGNITGDFIGNYSASYAGAISNDGTIDNVIGDFIGNYVQSTNLNNSSGGAIGNGGTIASITGDFINNYIKSSNTAYGGAIYNSSIIGNIVGNFINNYIEADKDVAGGGIYSTNNFFDNQENKIIGNFINNYAKSLTSSALGGAIYIKSTNDSSITPIIQELPGHFISNYVEGETAQGGAIYTGGNLPIVKGNFIENKATGITSASGGAIYNSEYYNGYKTQFCGTIGTITGEYISNSAEATNGNAQGGAITNAGVIDEINSNFVNNYTKSVNGSALGGAIYNSGTIIKYNAPDNKMVSLNVNKATYINEVTSEKITIYNMYAYESGIYGKNSLIQKLGEGYKIKNINASEYPETVISESEWEYYTNSDTYSKESIDEILTEDDYAKVIGGGIINTSFIGNYAQAEGTDAEAKGGAIYTTKDLNIIADNGESVFSGNYTETNGVKDDNAIYLDNADGTLNFELKNGGSIVMKDNIDGVEGYNVNIQGDDINKTIFYMHNDIRNSNLSTGTTTLHAIDNLAHVYNVNSYTLTGDTNFLADVDLANEEMDRITSESYGTHSGNLNVIGMNLLSDAPEDRDTTEIFFAETGLKDNVVNGTGELPDSNYQTAYTPIYKYNVSYDNREDGGYFVFAKGGLNSSNQSDNYNPSVLTTPTANLAAGQAAMNETFKYVFEHADAFTQLPAMERYAKINANKYAISTDFNNNLPSYSDQLHNEAVWFRPYTTFETMNLKNGPKVDAITYGSLVGYDGDFKEMKNGWNRVFTGYAGYMGSSLNYSGVDTTMNGGLLGFTETFYKGNFWTAITASAGAAVSESHTMYGKEDSTSLLAGVGSKTGYNFEFKDGKFIIQPIMFLSYTFVNTFDYTNAAGVKIESDPLHTIQLNPSVRFIGNLKNGWQPYASVGMVWNLMNESKATANNVKLPEMSIKPYVEYGLGVQRNWKDKFTAFFQAMVRNGGRNGIAFTGGFRMMLGSDPSKNSDKPKVKKEIKSL